MKLSVRVFFLSLLSLGSLLPAQAIQKVDAVVIGAGLSGLATAYHLKQAGLTFRILELTPRIGGRVRTTRYEFDGEPVSFADSGMEEYWASNPAVGFLEKFKLPLRREEAMSSVKLQGKLYSLRDDDTFESYTNRLFSAEDQVALAGFKKTVEPILQYLKPDHSVAIPPQVMALKDKSFAEWVREQRLPPQVSEWIRVSIECEVATSWDSFSALDGIGEFHIFMGKGEKAIRVIGGNENFTRVFAQKVGLNNILLNRRVSRVETAKDGQSVTVSYVNMANHQHEKIVASHVVSTVPLFRAVFEIQFIPALSEAKMDAIKSQTWGSYFKAHVFVKDSPEVAKHSWAPEGSSILPILSDSPLGVIYDGNRDSPNAKTKVISLLVSGEDAERFNLMPLHAVEGRLRGEFEKLWPGFNRFIRGMEFYRFHPRAIAGWPVGRSRYDELSDAVRWPENRVYFAGDFTESTHSDGAFWSAWRVAQQIQATRVRNLAEKVRDLKKSSQMKDVKAATPGGLAQ